MKIIIEKDCIKREIEGSFKLCAHKNDLESLAKQINEAIQDFHYGWITIYADVPHTMPNNPARPWSE